MPAFFHNGDMALTISVQDLVEAMETASPETGYFLDRETGELVVLAADDEDGCEALNAARENRERYFEIQPLPSRAVYGWMVEFAEKQRPTLQDRLLNVLNRPRPFKRFQLACANLGLRDAWYAYRDRRAEEFARAWGEENGLDVH
jgi:hypothetical protein